MGAKPLRVSNFSAYARPESHLTTQTVHGALVTLCGVLFALTLGYHETANFYRLHRVTKMEVDLERRRDLVINLDIVFPAIPCAVLSLDVLDISGTAESDASYARHMHIHKMRIDKDGRHIGKAEYHTPQSQQILDTGAEQMISVNIQEAMQHLLEMEDEAGRREGCHVYGTMDVKRVAGRVHFSVHQGMVFQLLPQLLGGHQIPKILNMSHTIQHFGFGPHFPGQVNPLDGFVHTVEDKAYAYKYFLKVVPTQYYSRAGWVTETHQYSVTEYAQPLGDTGAPSIDIHYDLSPIVMTINEKPPSFLHYIVRLCAVIGGVIALTGVMDRWVHWLVTSIQQALSGPPPSRPVSASGTYGQQ